MNIGYVDLSFGNEKLYRGCDIEKAPGNRYNLRTYPPEAVPILRRNLEQALVELRNEGAISVQFTGPVPPWIYLLAGKLAAAHFSKVRYSDGKVSFEI